MHETERIITEVLDAGASGIVLKSDAGENMVLAVESIAKGRRFFTSHVAETVVEAYLSRKSGTAPDPGSQLTLTTREREVIQLLAEGKSNKEVAWPGGKVFVQNPRVCALRKGEIHCATRR